MNFLSDAHNKIIPCNRKNCGAQIYLEHDGWKEVAKCTLCNRPYVPKPKRDKLGGSADELQLAFHHVPGR